MKLGETIKRWVDDAVERLRQDPTNARRTSQIVARFLAEAGIESVDDLRAPGLMEWLRREATAKAPRTVRNELAAVRQWSRFLEATGEVERAPFESVKVARCDSDDGCDAITDEQAERLLANAREECRSERWQVSANAPARLAAYVLMLDCGLRIGEVRAQRWSDVDLERRTMRISRDKARRKDVIALPRRAVAVLRWLRRVQVAEGLELVRVVPAGPNAKKLRAALDR
ncbi:MAG: tyrosine-type recombinase/integrase, partial [Phycisphaerales bacterium]